MNTNKKLYNLVVAGLLCSIGIVVPMFMPRIIIGPMSFTVGSHVAIFIAMFISPMVAIAVSIGTTIGFFITAPAIIALRAASHIIFAAFGSVIIQKRPKVMRKLFSIIWFGFMISTLHAVSEIIVVTPVFFKGLMFSSEQISNGYLLSVLILVGVGTLIHSMIDLGISVLIWKQLEHTMRSFKAIKAS